jgi:hypothetical protein
VKVTDSLSESGSNPSVAADDSANVYVVWQDTRDFGSYGHDIYFAFSSDSGQTFAPNVCVNDHMGIAGAWDWNPSVCVNDSADVYVAWFSGRNDPSGNNPDIYCASGILTCIEEDEMLIVNTGCINVYPNPFRERIEIKYQIPETGSNLWVCVKVYNIAGRLVRTLVNEPQDPGYYRVLWDGKDNLDNAVSSGIYFYRIEAGNFTAMKKIVKTR